MSTPYNTNLPPDLRKLKEEIEAQARAYGLDFYETIFEVLDGDDLNEVAAYGGFPTRYPHWSFGMQYEQLKKGYDYGLSKIYEMVINNDPCYAYLMRGNHVIDQKLVMAHVYGHCLAPETVIQTEDGDRLIPEVRVGDNVLTHTGQYRPVRVCAQRHFRGRIYCIWLEGCETPLRITGEHPVFALQPKREWRHRPRKLSDWMKTWVGAQELRAGSHVVMPRTGSLVLATNGPGLAATASPPGDIACFDKYYLYPRVNAVETEEYDGLVYNFSVDTDESYTLAAGMVVHNCDFFKNNAYFSHTNRKMMDEMANHGSRLRRYAEKQGEDEVEAFIDRCMSIDDLIDVHSTAIRRREEVSRYDFAPEQEDDSLKPTRFKSKDYMDDYINPRALLKAEEDEKKKQKEHIARSFPERPEKDVLLFLIENAPLKGWQKDVLSIIRDEAYYFAPQAQTKVLNEGWACTAPGSLVYTDQGLLRIEDIVNQRWTVRVSDGQSSRSVYDWAKFTDRKTVWVRTRRGFELEGSLTHRVLLANGSWRPLDEIQLGDRVPLGGANLWSQAYVTTDWRPKRRLSLAQIASEFGMRISTVRRYRYKKTVLEDPVLAERLKEYAVGLATMTTMQNRRRTIRVPDLIDEKLAAVMGYLVGDGHISKVKRVLGLTTGDEEQADRFAHLVDDVFGIKPRKKRDEGRWRVEFNSKDIEEFLTHLGHKTGVSARVKTVPDGILRSPKSVIAAFLRAYFDCDGYAGEAGVILATFSESLGKTVQLLLLNFGILSSRRRTKEGGWQVQAMGKSAVIFLREIGFGLRRKQEALRKYVDDHKWFLKQDWSDEIVAIERRRSDVYDLSVEETHRYAAQGFINHNSFWHSTIMTQKSLDPSELIDYADHHSGTMATYGARLNPYKLGIELLRDIEHRWNTGKFGKEYDDCDDLEKRRKWDKQLGLGRQKIFEVRRVHNDITFIDTFLTPEFCVEYKLFAYAFQEQMGQYVIESRDFEKIKQRLLFSLTNFGKPFIYVVDGNYHNRGELLLRHEFSGVELKQDYATATLANIQAIWSRPVHLQTVVDGKPTLLSFDGSDHSTRTLGDSDDPRRNAPAKTR